MPNQTHISFYPFKFSAIWRYSKSQPLAFWAICSYLFIEFTRPQSIYPAIDILPWAQIFLVLSVVGGLVDKHSTLIKSRANGYIVLFLLSVSLSTLAAIYPEQARANYHTFFIWVIVYFLITSIINSRERFYIFFLVFFLSSVKIAFGVTKIWASRGFSFTAWGLKGPPGFFEDSGELSVLMLLLFPIAYYFWEVSKSQCSKLERYICMLCWISPVIVILGASSRGAQVALAVQLCFIFRRHIWSLKKIIVISVMFVSFWSLMPEEQKVRLYESGGDKSSTQRLLYWSHGWEMIKEHPLSGVGFFNFSKYYEDHHREDMLYAVAQLPHNVFIQVGTDTGFPGLFLYVLIIIYCLRESHKISASQNALEMDKVFARGLGIGLVGFIVAGQFVSIAYYPFLWIILPMIASLANITRQ